MRKAAGTFAIVVVKWQCRCDAHARHRRTPWGGAERVKRSMVLLWIFFSLLAISFSGDNAILAILIAALGGIVIGAMIFADYRRRG